MSDSTVTAEVPSGVPNSAEVPNTAGSKLRLAREAAGLHIGALAVSLKVPVKKLEALEGDRIDLLPDAVFARALASSVCRTLKIDPLPILADLPQSKMARLLPDTLADGETFREPDQTAKRTLQELKTKPFVLIGLALVAATLGIAFFPGFDKIIPVLAEHSSGLSNASPPVEQTQRFAAPVPTDKGAINEALNSGPGGTIVTASSNGDSAVPTSLPDVKNSVIAATPVSTSMPTTAGATSAPSVPVGGAGLLVLKTKGLSWVEVTDAAGVVQLRKTMVEGETVGVSGGLPLSVVIGKADITEVQVRGKALDLTSIAKDNIARFEVR